MSEKVNIALLLSYNGSDYTGSSLQPNKSSISHHLIEALKKHNLFSTIPVFAGRTDKGVSASRMVVSFEIVNYRPTMRIGDMLNDVLPDDIIVGGFCIMPMSFNARFSCSLRHYKYFYRFDLCELYRNTKLMNGFSEYLVKDSIGLNGYIDQSTFQNFQDGKRKVPVDSDAVKKSIPADSLPGDTSHFEWLSRQEDPSYIDLHHIDQISSIEIDALKKSQFIQSENCLAGYDFSSSQNNEYGDKGCGESENFSKKIDSLTSSLPEESNSAVDTSWAVPRALSEFRGSKSAYMSHDCLTSYCDCGISENIQSCQPQVTNTSYTPGDRIFLETLHNNKSSSSDKPENGHLCQLQDENTSYTPEYRNELETPHNNKWRLLDAQHKEILVNYIVRRMNEACKHIQTLKCFKNLCKKSFEKQSKKQSKPFDDAYYTRPIYSIKIIKEDEYIYMDIKSKSFLHNMVRRIFNTVLSYGTFVISEQELFDILFGDRVADNALAGNLMFCCCSYEDHSLRFERARNDKRSKCCNDKAIAYIISRNFP